MFSFQFFLAGIIETFKAFSFASYGIAIFFKFQKRKFSFLISKLIFPFFFHFPMVVWPFFSNFKNVFK
jgi:hypothetical protein